MNKLIPVMLLLSVFALFNLTACLPPPPPAGGDTTDPTDTSDGTGGGDTTDGAGDSGDTGGDTTDDPADEANAGDVSDTALNYKGTVSAQVLTTSSTQGADLDNSSKLDPRAISSNATAWVTDINGDPLLDEEGNPYEPVSVNTDGTVDLSDLPVGMDLVLWVDLDGDEEADVITIFQIPAEEDGETGSLSDMTVDPLSTLIFARLQQVFEEKGIDWQDLDLSLTGLVERTRDAYENLYYDSGIEHEIDIDDLTGKILAQMADLFEEILPAAAKRGMQMAESNFELAAAKDVNSVVLAASKILVQGGFVIMDDPDGVDLTPLEQLPHVEGMTFEQYDQYMNSLFDFGDEMATEDMPFFEDGIKLYLSTMAEPDRNFAGIDEELPMPTKPWLGEYMLTKLAEMYLDGKQLTLDDIHQLIVDAETGLGARLAYNRWSMEDEFPATVFESPDGEGIAKNEMDFWDSIMDLDMWGPNATGIDEFRAALVDFLSGTVEPSFQVIFGGITMQRIPNPKAFGRSIRQARAHLPFSRSGPSKLYVVATHDPWMNPELAGPVTVDLEQNDVGTVTEATYNSQGNGRYFLSFGAMTETGQEVSFVHRATGRTITDTRGWEQWVDMADETVFQAVGSDTFFEKFSDGVTEYPSGPGPRFPNPGFDPEQPADPETNPPDFDSWVLYDSPGPDGEPILVDYANDVATYSEAGRYYLVTDWDSQGLYNLITEQGDMLMETQGDWDTRIQIDPAEIEGIDLQKQSFFWVYGIDVPNPGYDPSGAPFYDDINNNGLQDAGEPVFSEVHYLWDANDWRSTMVELYYRRADNDGFVKPDQVAWENDTPAIYVGSELVQIVPRNFRPRLNAFLFPRPNSAINLLMAFSPPELFDGTHAFDEDTPVNPFMAIAIIDLVFEKLHNVEAVVDWDGPGPLQPIEELTPAWLWMGAMTDPLQLIVDSFYDAGRVIPQQ